LSLFLVSFSYLLHGCCSPPKPWSPFPSPSRPWRKVPRSGGATPGSPQSRSSHPPLSKSPREKRDLYPNEKAEPPSWALVRVVVTLWAPAIFRIRHQYELCTTLFCLVHCVLFLIWSSANILADEKRRGTLGQIRR
jgi:hypothetical protein